MCPSIQQFFSKRRANPTLLQAQQAHTSSATVIAAVQARLDCAGNPHAKEHVLRQCESEICGGMVGQMKDKEPMTVKPFQTGHGGAGTVEMELEPTTLRKHDKSGSVPPSGTVGVGTSRGSRKIAQSSPLSWPGRCTSERSLSGHQQDHGMAAAFFNIQLGNRSHSLRTETNKTLLTKIRCTWA